MDGGQVGQRLLPITQRFIVSNVLRDAIHGFEFVIMILRNERLRASELLFRDAVLLDVFDLGENTDLGIERIGGFEINLEVA